jgi:hypothetical protein
MCASIPWTTASIRVLCATPMSRPLWLQFKKSSPCSLYRVRKVNTLACHFILCSSVSIFGTQREHNFWKWSFADTISWSSDRKICGKWRESDEMVNHLFCWFFSSTARTKSSLTTDGWPLRWSSCTFPHPALKCLTHLLTTESLMACSPYTSQSWRWMSADFMFSCIPGTDYRPHFTYGGLLDFLEHCKRAGQCANVVRVAAKCVHAFQKDQQSPLACAPYWPQHCTGNICKRNLFCGYTSYNVKISESH